MNLIKQLSSSSVILGFSFISRFLLTLALARNLSSDEMGIYSWVITVFGFMGILTNFGLDYFLIRKVPEYRNSDIKLIGSVIHHTQRTANINALVLIIIIFTMSIILAQLYAGASKYTDELLIISLALPFAAFSLIFSTSLRGYDFALTAQVIESIVQTGFLLLAVFLMFHFYGDLIPAERRTILLAAVFVVSWVVSCGVAFFHYRKQIKLPDILAPTRDKVREWRAEQSSIVFGIIGWTILGRSDIFLLAFLVAPSQVGAYFLCMRLAELLMFFSTVSFYVWTGKISNLIQLGELGQAQVIVTKAAQLCIITTAAITLAALFYSYQILSFFNESYADNETLFRIAVCIFFFKGASGLLRPLFYLLKDQDFMAKYNWIMGIAFTILVIIVVPTFGTIGCVIAFGICEITFIIILALRMQKKFNISILPF